MTDPSIDLNDSATEKIADLYTLCGELVAQASPGADAVSLAIRSWFYTYLMWHESAGLTTRQQGGGGPGRGLMQFEATTAWDTVKWYVLGPVPGLMARLAAASGLDLHEELAPTLRAFGYLENPQNVWPSEGLAAQVEQWLLSNDRFAICLMQLQFERFSAPVPPVSPPEADADPHDPVLVQVYANTWADYWWKGPTAVRPARLRSFLDSAAGLDRALQSPDVVE